MNFLRKRVLKFHHICIIDRFLILFTIVLFIYTSVHLLLGTDMSQNNNSIDIIIRTSIASIFGYFMSNNFTNTSSDSVADSAAPPVITTSSEGNTYESKTSVKNRIGFQTTQTLPDDFSKGSSSVGNIKSRITQPLLQIYIVSFIGLFSLGILIIARHLSPESTEITAIVSQLRDFVSASIGFLISCKKNNN